MVYYLGGWGRMAAPEMDKTDVRKSLKLLFCGLAASEAVLMLSPDSAAAMEAGGCIDTSQLDAILGKEGQSKIITAVQSPWIVKNQPVGNDIEVTYTSDTAG